MKTIYLHIGTHKTGSTSLQYFLQRAAPALREQGLLYPAAARAERLPNAHHPLAWHLLQRPEAPTDAPWRHVRDEIEGWQGDKVVLSAEDFCLCTPAQIQQALQYLAPHRVEVVLYLRQPLDFLVSLYKQHLMSKGVDSLRAYLHEVLPRGDFLSLVQRWHEAAQVQQLHLRLFNKVKQAPGLEADLAHCLGIDVAPLRPFIAAPVHVSPKDQVLRAVRLVNRAERWVHHRLPLGDTAATVGRRLRRDLYRQNTRGRWLRRLLPPWRPAGRLVNEMAPADWSTVRAALQPHHDAFLAAHVAPEDWAYLQL